MGACRRSCRCAATGTVRYHFDAVLWNSGGAFELEGSGCDGAQCPTVTQRIWSGDGTPGGSSRTEEIPGSRLIIEVGDGHGHYHYENASLYELLVPGEAARATAKIGFCMFDTFPDPKGNAPTSYYPKSEGPCEASGSSVEMGISRGWGDYYNRDIAKQWIAVTGLPAGAYTLRSTVNPGREFIEANYDDNVLEETRVIPGATAADVAISGPVDVQTTGQLSGTVEGRDIKVFFQGGATHRSASAELSFEILTQPENGTLTAPAKTGDATAEVTYTPSPGFAGSDSFTYETTDDRGLTSNPATATITVGNAPESTRPPTVSGAPVVGRTLGAMPGRWSDESLTFAYRWQRCDRRGRGCVEIPGSTAASHVIVADDVRSKLRVQVEASSPFGSAAATSNATAAVTALPLVRDRKSKLLRQLLVGSKFADFLEGTAVHEAVQGTPRPRHDRRRRRTRPRLRRQGPRHTEARQRRRHRLWRPRQRHVDWRQRPRHALWRKRPRHAEGPRRQAGCRRLWQRRRRRHRRRDRRCRRELRDRAAAGERDGLSRQSGFGRRARSRCRPCRRT